MRDILVIDIGKELSTLYSKYVRVNSKTNLLIFVGIMAGAAIRQKLKKMDEQILASVDLNNLYDLNKRIAALEEEISTLKESKKRTTVKKE